MKNYKMIGLVLTAFLVCLVGTSRAELVPNGDFSSGLSGWGWQGGWSGVTTDGSPDGPSARVNGNAWLYQPGVTSSTPFVEGQTYALSFLAILLDDDSNTSPNFTAGITTPSGNEHNTIITPTDTWQEYTVTFTATAADVGSTYQPQFLGIPIGETVVPGTFGLDTITLSAVSVPEPSTMMLLLCALGAVALLRRRQA